MSKEIVLLRHFEDERAAYNYRNGNIIEVQQGQIECACKEISRTLEETGRNSIVFITSPLYRAVQTTNLVTQQLKAEKDIEIQIEIDARLSALRHGIYRELDPASLLKVESDAWRAFVDQTFNKGNILYRHGDPFIEEGAVKYPELLDMFTEYGENQLEFTIRTYSFILDIVPTYDQYCKDGKMMVISSHLAPLLRMNEILNLSKKGLPPLRGKFIGAGRMFLEEWGQMPEIVNMPEIKKILIPGGFALINFEDLTDYLPAIDSELHFLVALNAQVSRRHCDTL